MMDEIKLRSGRAPEYVEKFGDLCTCGSSVLTGQASVWFPYHYSYLPAGRCGDCARRQALGGCYYHRWERILHQEQEKRTLSLQQLTLPPESSLYFQVIYRAREAVETESREEIAEARRKMDQARTHYKAFHLGCRVNEAVKDEGLKVRIIRLMNRRLQGAKRVDLGKALARA